MAPYRPYAPLIATALVVLSAAMNIWAAVPWWMWVVTIAAAGGAGVAWWTYRETLAIKQQADALQRGHIV